MRKLFAAKLLMLCLVGTAAGDQWTFFYPEHVKRYGCTAEEVVVQINGVGSQQERWVARAWAERDLPEAPHWSFDISMYPDTDKGFDAAWKDCRKWEHQARKRVLAAR